MSHRTKRLLIISAVLLLIFAPATFMMLVEKGFDTGFVIFNTVVEKLNNLPTATPTP